MSLHVCYNVCFCQNTTSETANRSTVQQVRLMELLCELNHFKKWKIGGCGRQRVNLPRPFCFSSTSPLTQGEGDVNVSHIFKNVLPSAFQTAHACVIMQALSAVMFIPHIGCESCFSLVERAVDSSLSDPLTETHLADRQWAALSQSSNFQKTYSARWGKSPARQCFPM